MSATPSPTMLPRELRWEELAHHRAQDCAHYDDCLGRACHTRDRGALVQSWSCAGCPVGGLPPATLAVIRSGDAVPRTTRIVDTLHSVDTPLTVAEIADEIGADPLSVAGDLSKLALRGLAVKVAPRVYARPGLPGVEPHAPPPNEEGPSLRARVAAVVQASSRVWTAPALAAELGETDAGRVASALRDLAHDRKIGRRASGFFTRIEP